ncbi:unnamed protein product, partial [Prorocentrum cordatum]
MASQFRSVGIWSIMTLEAKPLLARVQRSLPVTSRGEAAEARAVDPEGRGGAARPRPGPRAGGRGSRRGGRGRREAGAAWPRAPRRPPVPGRGRQQVPEPGRPRHRGPAASAWAGPP